MKDLIKVIAKKPGQPPQIGVIPNTLEAFQAAVDGYIETFPLFKDCLIICNEEGKLRKMRFNFEMCGETFVGPVIFVGVKGENFTDCPIRLEDLKAVRPSMWEV